MSDNRREEIMASQRISVRVPGGIARRLKERSRVTGARESQVVREALEQYLSVNRKEQTTYDLLQEAGLLGCVRGAPKDLSTNKRYFKGFGKSK
jgi:predicted DNA-binding protein